MPGLLTVLVDIQQGTEIAVILGCTYWLGGNGETLAALEGAGKGERT